MAEPKPQELRCKAPAEPPEAETGGADAEVQVIRPSNRLRAKLGTAPGPSLDQMVADAEAALESWHGDCEIWALNDLREIYSLLAAARANPAPDLENVRRILRLSHDIKGKGATFGYPLLTTIAQLLYRFIDRDEAKAATRLDLVTAHIDAMTIVVSLGIRGQGGALGTQLSTALEHAAEKTNGA